MGISDLTMQSSVRIALPRSRAWEVFADVRRWTEWSEVTLRSDVDEGFGWRVGENLRLRLRMARVGVPFNVRITESDFPPPPRWGRAAGAHEVGAGDAGPSGPAAARIAWASTKLTVTAVRTFTFADDGGGTLVTDEKVFTSSILPIRLFYPRPIIRRMTESFLADLKAECERAT